MEGENRRDIAAAQILWNPLGMSPKCSVGSKVFNHLISYSK